MELREGGYGWLVVVASFVVHTVTWGTAYSSSAIYTHLLETHNKTKFETAGVSTVVMSMTALCGPLSTVLVYFFGYRVTVMTGGILATTGMAASALTSQLWEMFVTMGLVAGLGFGLALTPSVLVLQTYFDEKYALASGIATSGINVGVIFLPIAISKLTALYEWRWVATMLAAAAFTIWISGTSMKVNDDLDILSPTTRRQLLRMFELCLWKNVAFVCLCMTNFLWSMGVSIVYTHLPMYASASGYTSEESLVLIGIVGLASLTSRILFIASSQTEKLDHISIVLCGVGLTTILTAIFPKLFQHSSGIIGYAIMFGWHSGFWSTFTGGLATDFVGNESMAHGRGFISLAIGAGLAIGAPLAGYMLDKGSDYKAVFYLAGGCLLLSSAVLLVVNLAGHRLQFGSKDWDTTSKASSSSKNSQKSEKSGPGGIAMSSRTTSV